MNLSLGCLEATGKLHLEVLARRNGHLSNQAQRPSPSFFAYFRQRFHGRLARLDLRSSTRYYLPAESCHHPEYIHSLPAEVSIRLESALCLPFTYAEG